MVATDGRRQRVGRIHPAWFVAAAAFVALLGAAGFRSAPGVFIVPLQEEFGWTRGTLSLAVSVNLVLFGLMAPFAAGLLIYWITSNVLTLAQQKYLYSKHPQLRAQADKDKADRETIAARDGKAGRHSSQRGSTTNGTGKGFGP